MEIEYGGFSSKIEVLRRKLEQDYIMNNMTSNESIISISQELDTLIIEFYDNYCISLSDRT